jgi:hypothetical protein
VNADITAFTSMAKAVKAMKLAVQASLGNGRIGVSDIIMSNFTTGAPYTMTVAQLQALGLTIGDIQQMARIANGSVVLSGNVNGPDQQSSVKVAEDKIAVAEVKTGSDASTSSSSGAVGSVRGLSSNGNAKSNLKHSDSNSNSNSQVSDINLAATGSVTYPTAQVNYTVKFVLEAAGYPNATAAYNDVTDNLLKSASNGAFISNLKTAAQSVKLFGLSQVVLTKIQVRSKGTVVVRSNAPTFAPTGEPSPAPIAPETKDFLFSLPQQGYVWFPIAIAVGGFLFLLGLYYATPKVYRAIKDTGKWAPSKFSGKWGGKGFQTADTMYVYPTF